MTSLTQKQQQRFKQKSFISFESLMPITVSWKDVQTGQLNPHSNDAVTQKETLMAKWVNKAKLAKPKGQHAHDLPLHFNGHILKPSFVFPSSAIRLPIPVNSTSYIVPRLYILHILHKRRKTSSQVHRKVNGEMKSDCCAHTLKK